uniref:Uncharacterized protein n=1 Tax=Glossina palpalis gambiensis TaxID=67801 RepID=A0A1B0ART2_9MUSC
MGAYQDAKNEIAMRENFKFLNSEENLSFNILAPKLLYKLSCVTLEFLYSVCFTRNIFYTLLDVLKLPMDVKPMHSLMHAYMLKPKTY